MESNQNNDKGFSFVIKALDIIKRAARSIPPNKIGISFNGGKDSVVMTEMLIAAMGISFVSQCILFVLEDPDEFKELVEFRTTYIKNRLPLSKLLREPAHDGMREALWRVKNQTSIDLVFLGTRFTDPAGTHQQTPVSPTTEGWPPMTRVSPLFHWGAKDVWNYILQNDIPYCRLYKEGYSSLGSRSSTNRNPLLLLPGEKKYKPAWSLTFDVLERNGRG